MKGGYLKPSLPDFAARFESTPQKGALAEAVVSGNFPVFVWLLLAKPAGVDERRGNDTPLLAAARHRAGDARYVEMLVAAGADASPIDAKGDSAAHVAAAARGAGASLRAAKALLLAPTLGTSFAEPNGVGHRAVDQCASLDAFELLRVATEWSRLGPNAPTATLLAPHAAAALACALERLARRKWLPAAPLAIFCAALAGACALRSSACAAAVAHPRSCLGSGVASAMALTCAVSTYTMLRCIRQRTAVNVAGVDDATLLSYAHGAVYVMYLALYALCAWRPVPPRERVRRIFSAERASFVTLARAKPGAFLDMRFCPACCAFKPSASPDFVHCSRCNTCVHQRDHHCVLLGRCVARHNQWNFVSLLGATVFVGVSCGRIAAWFFALRCGVAAGPIEPRIRDTVFAMPLTLAKCAFGGDLGLTAALHFIIVPLGCVFVSYALSQQLLLICGISEEIIEQSIQDREKEAAQQRPEAATAQTMKRD
ncbi:hypothetical protein M885DRAFT_505425 [Pelagophyceae sp. CCMP2097]|nr:hypothetical protein M885DRAFT_505425 [Pelagophyceae sp. CCMP2097]|mmetsp:Transcript_21544/g.74180  ORF Transcript_21544/g.74180 Transcript_21544/m.74180 type:complete len:485 (-) Transcript_21544:38-1492(-)